MKNIAEIIRKYTAGEATLEETNAALAGSGLELIPGKNELTEKELRATTVGAYPEQANGFGLLETGTGTMDKAQVKAGAFDHAINEVYPDGATNMFTMFHIGGKIYEVKGTQLVNFA